jgi:hypothetical protein
MRKVKCFACHKMGHYARRCPNRKKKKKGGTTTTADEEFTTQFERECDFIVCCLTVESPSSIWYVDIGASCNMSGVREHFTNLRDPEIRLEIMLGDNTIVRALGCGTIPFQRESRPPISFRDVLFVPGLKKNLISVSSLQDRGLEVSFKGTKVLIHPKGSSIASGKVIGVEDGKLHRFSF